MEERKWGGVRAPQPAGAVSGVARGMGDWGSGGGLPENQGPGDYVFREYEGSGVGKPMRAADIASSPCVRRTDTAACAIVRPRFGANFGSSLSERGKLRFVCSVA